MENIWDYFLYPNKGYWFLWALFFIALFFNFTNFISERVGIKQDLWIFVVAILLVFFQLQIRNTKIFGYEYIAYYFIFYVLGYYANKYQRFLPKQELLICGCFFLWLLMACFWTPNDIPFILKDVHFIPSQLLQLCYRMLTPMVFLVWMYSVAPKIKVGNSWIWKLLIEFGQISLGIYVVHMVVKNLFAQKLYETVPIGPFWLHVVIEFIILTVFSIVVVRLILKSNVLAKWLLGKI